LNNAYVHLIARNFITELGLPLLYYHKKAVVVVLQQAGFVDSEIILVVDKCFC